MAKNEITKVDGLVLRGNRASAGFRAHVLISDEATGRTIGRVFADSVPAAWELVPARIEAFKAKNQKKVDDTAAVEAAEVKAEDEARAAAIARLTSGPKNKAVKSADAETTEGDK